MLVVYVYSCISYVCRVCYYCYYVIVIVLYDRKRSWRGVYDDSQAFISTAEEQLLVIGACDVCLWDCNGFLSISVITFIYLHGCTPPFCRLTSELSQPQKFT